MQISKYILFILFLSFFLPSVTHGDYFRSQGGGGNWNVNGTWEQSADNVTWGPAGTTPNATTDIVTISLGAPVTLNTDVTVYQLDINDALNLSSNLEIYGNIAIAGTGSLVASAGTVTINGTTAKSINNAGTLTFYNLTLANAVGNNVTTASSFSIDRDLTVNTNGSLVASGGTISMSGSAQSIANAGTLTFFNLTINATSQSSTSSNFTISGDFAVANGGLFEANGGTITFNGAGKTLTVNNNYSAGASGAKFNNLSVSGSLTNNSNFLAVIGVSLSVVGTFNCTTGEIRFTGAGTISGGGAITFYTLTIGDGAGDYITCTSNFTVSNSMVVNASAYFSATAGTVTLTGTATVTPNNNCIAATSGIQFNNLTSSGTNNSFIGAYNTQIIGSINVSTLFSMPANSTVTIAGTTGKTIISAGTLAFHHLTLANAVGNSVTTSSSFEIHGDLTVNTNGSLVASGGTVSISGTTGKSIATSGTLTFYHLAIANAVGNSVTTSSSFEIYGNLSVNTNGSLNATGGGTSEITFNGTTGKTITNDGTLSFFHLTVANAVGNSVTTSSNFEIHGNLNVNTNGSLDATGGGTSLITINGTAGKTFTNDGTLSFNHLTIANAVGNSVATSSSFEIHGDLTVNANGSIVASGGTVTINGTAAKTITNSGTLTFYHLTVANAVGNSVATSSNFEIHGDLNIYTNGSFDATGGAISNITINGTAAKSISNSGTLLFYDLTIANSVGNSLTTSSSFEIHGDLTVNANGSIVASGGVISMNGNTQSIVNSGVLTFYSLAIIGSSETTTSSNFTINGNLSLSGAYFNATGGTITLSGSGTIATNADYTALTSGMQFNNLSVTGSYTQIGNYSIQIIGATQALNVSGSFIPGTGTIVFSGDAVIVNTGTLTFYNIACGAGVAVLVTTSSNFNIAANFTVLSAGCFEATANTISFIGSGSIFANSNYITATSGIKFNNTAFSGSYQYPNAFAFHITGDINVTGSFQMSNGRAVMYGNANQTITNTGNLKFYDLEVDGAYYKSVSTASNFYILKDFIVDGATTGAYFKATAGTIYIGDFGSSLDFYGADTTVTFHNIYVKTSSVNIASSGSFIVNGNFTVDNSFSNINNQHTGHIWFTGSSQQSLIGNQSANILISIATLDNSAGLVLSGPALRIEGKLQITRYLEIENGFIDLNGESKILLEDPAGIVKVMLYEKLGKTVINSVGSLQNGYIAYRYTYTGGVSNENMGGLGFTLNSAGSPGLTLIKRFPSDPLLGGASSNRRLIKRYFEVTTANAVSNADVTLYYDPVVELNGSNKNSLYLLTTDTDPLSGDNSVWVSRKDFLNDTLSYNLRITNINGFEGELKFWSASDLSDLIVDVKVISRGVVDGEQAVGKLTAGRYKSGIFGFSIYPLRNFDINKLIFKFLGNLGVTRFLSSPNAEFIGYELVLSGDDNYSTKEDNAVICSSLFGSDSRILGGSAGDSSVAFDLSAANDIQKITAGRVMNYFLIVRMNNTPNINSSLDTLQILLSQEVTSQNDYIFESAKFVGTKYTFQPGIYITWIPDGLAIPPLIPTSRDTAIAGFSTFSTFDCTFRGFSVDFNEDPSNKIENLKLWSSNQRYFKKANSTEIASEIIWSPDKKTAYISFGSSAEPIDRFVPMGLSAQRYYFVTADIKASVNATANLLIPSIRRTKIVSIDAGYTPNEDTIKYYDNDFRNLEAFISTGNMPASRNLGKGVKYQPIYGFTLNPRNNLNITFSKLTITVQFANSSKAENFSNFRLWYDANGDGIPQMTESGWTGVFEKVGSSEGLITFSNITSQTFQKARKYIITCDVASNAANNGTIVLTIADQNKVELSSPCYIQAGGPYSGNINTIKNANSEPKMSIIAYSSKSIVTGQSIDITVQLKDNFETPMNATAQKNLTVILPVGCAVSGNLSGIINVGSDLVTISGIILTNSAGTLNASFSITDGTVVISSDIIKIFLAEAAMQATLNAIGSIKTYTSLSVDSWAAGSGDGRIIVIREGYPPEPPVDGVEYIPNSNIASAGNVGVGQTGQGSYVVYSNRLAQSNPFTVQSLTSGSRYYAAVYEFAGAGMLTKYNISSDNSNVLYDTTLTSAGNPYGNNSSISAPAFIATDTDVWSSISDSSRALSGAFFSFSADEARNNILIRLSELPVNYNLELFNTSGRRLRESSNTSGNEVIIINNLEPGKYILRVFGKDGSQYSPSRYKIRINTSPFRFMSVLF